MGRCRKTVRWAKRDKSLSVLARGRLLSQSATRSSRPRVSRNYCRRPGHPNVRIFHRSRKGCRGDRTGDRDARRCFRTTNNAQRTYCSLSSLSLAVSLRTFFAITRLILQRLIPRCRLASNQMRFSRSWRLLSTTSAATWLGHHYPGTEHLLLGICTVPHAHAYIVLDTLDLPPLSCCQDVLEILGHGDDWERWRRDHATPV